MRRLYNFYKKLPRKRNLCEPCAHSPKRKNGRRRESEGAKKENLFFIDRRENFLFLFLLLMFPSPFHVFLLSVS